MPNRLFRLSASCNLVLLWICMTMGTIKIQIVYLFALFVLREAHLI